MKKGDRMKREIIKIKEKSGVIMFKSILLILSALIINYSAYAAEASFSVSIRLLKPIEVSQVNDGKGACVFNLRGGANDEITNLIVEDSNCVGNGSERSFKVKGSKRFDSNGEAKIRIAFADASEANSCSPTLRIVYQ